MHFTNAFTDEKIPWTKSKNDNKKEFSDFLSI